MTYCSASTRALPHVSRLVEFASLPSPNKQFHIWCRIWKSSSFYAQAVYGSCLTSAGPSGANRCLHLDGWAIVSKLGEQRAGIVSSRQQGLIPHRPTAELWLAVNKLLVWMQFLLFTSSTPFDKLPTDHLGRGAMFRDLHHKVFSFWLF